MNQPNGQFIDWRAVYDEQMPRIYNFFRYRVGDDALAEDLTSETFERAWKYRASYRSDMGAFSTWLFSIARNLSVDYFRRRRRTLPLDALRSSNGNRPVEERIQHNSEVGRLSVLLMQLQEREREIVALKYGAEMTNRAIADLTGLSESNVGTIIYRVVQRLRAEWEEKVPYEQQ